MDPLFCAYSPGLVTAGGSSSSCLQDISAAGGVLTVLLAGCQGGGEELDLEEIVLSDGAEHVLDHPLRARAEQVAELGGVRLWSWRTLKMSDIFKQTN